MKYLAPVPLPGLFIPRTTEIARAQPANAALRSSLLIYRLKDEFDLLARQQLELGTVHQRLLVFRIGAEHPHLEDPVACRPAIKTAGQAARVEGHAIDAQRASLELAAAGLKNVVFGALLTPVAPKLLRDRADDRLSVGQLPWCRYECCSRDNLHHRLSPFVDQAAFLHFGAVAASQSSSSCPCSTIFSAVDTSATSCWPSAARLGGPSFSKARL